MVDPFERRFKEQGIGWKYEFSPNVTKSPTSQRGWKSEQGIYEQLLKGNYKWTFSFYRVRLVRTGTRPGWPKSAARPQRPPKVKKMAMLLSSYSPNVYDGAIGEYRGIISYWGVEDTGIVTAKIDEQKTEATRSRILELVGKLSA